MELKDFVAATMAQIVDGVVEAQKHAASVGAWINPQDTNASTAFSRGNPTKVRFAEISGCGIYHNEVHVVEFDVAVTETEGHESKGGIGIVSVIKASGEKSSESSVESISRIKFNVPVVFPHQKPEHSPQK
jgi:hypothetical protein